MHIQTPKTNVLILILLFLSVGHVLRADGGLQQSVEIDQTPAQEAASTVGFSEAQE